MTAPSYDRIQLPRTMSIDAGESSWFCFEGTGDGPGGARRLAGLVWLHRTGPRVARVGPGFGRLGRESMPTAWSQLVPAWLPWISPVRLDWDDRPLLLMMLCDPERPSSRVWTTELPIEHDRFDPATFSGTTRGGELALQVHADTCGRLRASVRARTRLFDADLDLRGGQFVVFGDGSPDLRHASVEIGYAQRPRLEVTGTVRLSACRDAARDDADEHIADYTAHGAHDRHWRRATVLGLGWIWAHVRLSDGTTVTGYAVRQCRGRPLADSFASADDRDVVARRAWLVGNDDRVTPLAGFDIRVDRTIDGDRGRVPTRFVVRIADETAPIVLTQPGGATFLPLAAFGALVDGGVYEGPATVAAPGSLGARGAWIEVMDPSHARLRRP